MSGVAQEWLACRSSFLNVPAMVPCLISLVISDCLQPKLLFYLNLKVVQYHASMSLCRQLQKLSSERC
jgi:hypothetical protein